MNSKLHDVGFHRAYTDALDCPARLGRGCKSTRGIVDRNETQVEVTTMAKAEHTPTPWMTQKHQRTSLAEESILVESESGRTICDMGCYPESEDEANANFVVLACNAHDAILRAIPDPEKLRLLADWLDKQQMDHQEWSGRDVQADLRKWADAGEKALGTSD
jgi:antirestriction protein ArdC